MLSLLLVTPALAHISSFVIFSILHIPIIHLNILISVRSSKFCSAFLSAHVLLPYITLVCLVRYYIDTICCVEHNGQVI